MNEIYTFPIRGEKMKSVQFTVKKKSGIKVENSVASLTFARHKCMEHNSTWNDDILHV